MKLTQKVGFIRPAQLSLTCECIIMNDILSLYGSKEHLCLSENMLQDSGVEVFLQTCKI